ncbi:hypothetical protein MTO96_020727 [Rhipicephalus appendiculatus]
MLVSRAGPPSPERRVSRPHCLFGEWRIHPAKKQASTFAYGNAQARTLQPPTHLCPSTLLLAALQGRPSTRDSNPLGRKPRRSRLRERRKCVFEVALAVWLLYLVSSSLAKERYGCPRRGIPNVPEHKSTDKRPWNVSFGSAILAFECRSSVVSIY